MNHFEKTLLSKEIYKGKAVNLFCDSVQLENGTEASRDVIRHPGGVCVAALDENLNLLMVSQFRYPIGRELLELPAGKLEYGENPSECGLRELEEETGYTADGLELLGKLYPTPAYADEVIYIYYTINISESIQHLDEDEFLTVSKLPFWDTYKMVLNGEILDSKTQIAILKLGSLLRNEDHEK